MTILLNVEKTFNIFLRLFIIKFLSKQGIEGAFLNIIKIINIKHYTKLKKLNTFPLNMIMNEIKMSGNSTSIQYNA